MFHGKRATTVTSVCVGRSMVAHQPRAPVARATSSVANRQRSLLICATCAIAALASLPLTAAWAPDRFLISFWVDPVVPASEFLTQYETIAAANFTVLMGGFGATNPSDVKAQLAACEATGLAAIPNACEAGPEPANSTTSCVGLQSPALWGFQLYDEPQASEFPALRTWMESVAARAPGTACWTGCPVWRTRVSMHRFVFLQKCVASGHRVRGTLPPLAYLVPRHNRGQQRAAQGLARYGSLCTLTPT